ncbi:MFS transporter [Saccharopolyspora karakumensis]|uniref:MFS transporter n=1 Tax=Saccharopolyspora karakumensis TaxID=2530386 RepID=A0A4R5BBD9_9PSEU|nr:MFS transporter [Saccharopolyspora karakumensis]TDD83361.1 MFS transporter [Saccharopolyspora karakumensis]
MNSRVALYIGGLLGPFGGGIVAAMLPELSADYAVTPSLAATTTTTYLLPFALVMLVSGSLGERWGSSRTIRVAYIGYAVVAVLGAIAPWFWLFQLTRALQGVANAFTTPLLLSKIAAGTPRERLGRAMGTYGAMQAIGQTTAPLVGGLAAESAWQLAFVGVAAVAALLAVSPLPPDTEPAATRAPTALRDAWTPVVLLSGGIAGVAWMSSAGLPFLVSFRLDDAFALSPGARGLALTAYGIAGVLGARLTGSAVDRFGVRAMLITGVLSAALAIATIGLVDSLPVVVLAWAAAGACGQLILVAVHSTVLGGSGGGGAISVVTAWRFLGMSAAPAVFTGLYYRDAALGFGLAGLLLALMIPVVSIWWPRTPRASD